MEGTAGGAKKKPKHISARHAMALRASAEATKTDLNKDTLPKEKPAWTGSKYDVDQEGDQGDFTDSVEELKKKGWQVLEGGQG